MVEELHQHGTPAGVTAELEQGAGGGTANDRPAVGGEGLHHGQHLGGGDADVAEGFEEGFAGLDQPWAVAALAAGHLGATGETAAEGCYSFRGLELAEGPGSGFPEAIIGILEGVEQVGDRAERGGRQFAQGPGGIAGHGVFFHPCAGIAGPAQAEGPLEQGHGLGVLAAHAAQPPGSVVLLGGITGLAKAAQGFLLTNRFACLGGAGVSVGHCCCRETRAPSDVASTRAGSKFKFGPDSCRSAEARLSMSESQPGTAMT